MKGEQATRDNPYTYFRGIALQWFTSELSIDSKGLVKYGPGIEHWERQLFKRFKAALSLAVAIVMSEKYTMEDARRRREAREYSFKIMRAYQVVEMTIHLALTTVIYNGFHSQFKQDLPFPSTTTFVDTFLQVIDNCASEDKVHGYFQGSSAQRPKKRRCRKPTE